MTDEKDLKLVEKIKSEYTAKGERQHLNMLDSDMNYKDLLKALKDFDVRGVLVCESPNIEEDCKLFKDYYMSL